MFDNRDNFRLHIDKNDEEFYELLDGRNRHKFLFAMAYGFKNKVRLPLKDKDSGGHWRFNESDSLDRALVFAVALDENGHLKIDNEDDLKNVLEIAEEYAHGGVKLLESKMKNTQFGSFWKKIETDIFETIKDIQQINPE